jgi:predicted RNA binding protein YcfA (HicA-like mRNA interferase family)
MLAALTRAGFETRRIKGRHHYLVHRDDPSRPTTIAMHSGDLPRRDVRDILKQAGISRVGFESPVVKRRPKPSEVMLPCNLSSRN